MVDNATTHRVKKYENYVCFPLSTSPFWLSVIIMSPFPYLYATSQYGLSIPTVNITLYRLQIILITADMSYQSTNDTEQTTAATIVTNVRFFLQGKIHKQTRMLHSPTGQQLSQILGCTAAPRRFFHLMGLILPLHFAVLSWQGSQSSQHLLLMPLTGGYLLPYMFSLQLHHGRLEAAKPRCWDGDGHLFD